jgi:hypothetical protein
VLDDRKTMSRCIWRQGLDSGEEALERGACRKTPRADFSANTSGTVPQPWTGHYAACAAVHYKQPPPVTGGTIPVEYCAVNMVPLEWHVLYACDVKAKVCICPLSPCSVTFTPSDSRNAPQTPAPSLATHSCWTAPQRWDAITIRLGTLEER